MIPPGPPLWLLIAIYFLYLGLATTASVPLFANIDWLHEGERMGAVQIVLNGGLPIRDAYLTHGLFPDAIRPLLAFRMFGESLAADRLVGILIEPLAYVAAAFYVWKVFPTRSWRLVGLIGFALYPLLLVPRHIPVFLALGLLTAWVNERRGGLLFWAGMITGLGYVIGTFDHATFLLATVLLFPFAVMAEHVLLQLAGVARDPLAASSTRAGFFKVARPLFGGLLIGLFPFLSYLGLTGTAGLFLDDFVRRAEAEAYAFSHVWHHRWLPSLEAAHVMWYVVLTLYAVLTTVIVVRILRRGEQSWTAVLPTLLFGIVSFVYALRGHDYWKLAVVSFPFLVGITYALSVLTRSWNEQKTGERGGSSEFERIVVLCVCGVSMIVLLVSAGMHDWNPKQAIPRVLFPVLAAVVLAAAVTSVVAPSRVRPWRDGLLVFCTLAAVIVSAWFYGNAQPQVVEALLKKPRLVMDVQRLARSLSSTGHRLTREEPPYLQDEALSYLKAASQEGKRVVVLAGGAGMYYFHAGMSPPHRFPNIEIVLADAWAKEVISALDRTKADLLVACDDHGQRIGGWPILPNLSGFITANYVDSGRRLRSKMLGEGCPFSVWVHRKTRNGTSA